MTAEEWSVLIDALSSVASIGVMIWLANRSLRNQRALINEQDNRTEAQLVFSLKLQLAGELRRNLEFLLAQAAMNPWVQHFAKTGKPKAPKPPQPEAQGLATIALNAKLEKRLTSHTFDRLQGSLHLFDLEIRDRVTRHYRGVEAILGCAVGEKNWDEAITSQFLMGVRDAFSVRATLDTFLRDTAQFKEASDLDAIVKRIPDVDRFV